MATNNSASNSVNTSTIVGTYPTYAIMHTVSINNRTIVGSYSTAINGGYVSVSKPQVETVKPWHRWWAWRPVTTIGKKSVWGTWCYRRTVRNWNPAVNDYYEQIEYGDLFDMISSPAE